MSGTKGMTRRGFLETAGAVGVIGALASSMATPGEWIGRADAGEKENESVSYLYHRDHCGCHCSLKCTVRDNRVCLIEPNDAYQDEFYRHVCVKGISEIQHIYSSERIQSPMKRVGERGDAKFEAISWDEAYDVLIGKLKEVWDRYGHDAVLMHCSSECRPHYSLLPSVLGACTQGAVGIDMGIGNGRDPAFGPSKGCTNAPGEYLQLGAGWNRPTNEPRDLKYSKYILLVGNNVFHSVLSRSSMLLDAQEAGARLVAVDPNYSQVAAKSDEWIPIQPGTDPALYLGMASVIVNKKLYDESFMKARTDFPFLVDKTTGKRLTSGEPIPDGRASAGDELVWDNAVGSAVRHDEAKDPAISGEHVVDGIACCTVFDLFEESLEGFTVEDASKLTHIPADKLIEIATDYATSGASSLVTGYGGNDKILNADIAGHAIAALVALTGNIGKPGASCGSFADGFHGYQASLGSWKFSQEHKPATMRTKFFRLPYEENGIRMAIIAGDSPMNRTSNYSVTEKWLSSLDFLCAIDMYYTSYTDYADLVLPACTVFENEAPYAGVEAYGGYVLLREKAIDPLFESKSDYQIQIDIAQRLGLGDIVPRTEEEYIRTCIDTSADETISGITLDTLVANHGVQAQTCQSTIRRGYVDRFGTPSGRLELYYESMLPYGQELPKWEAPNECGEENKLRGKYPLYFATFKSKYRIHNQFWDSLWNNQYEAAHIEMNSEDMDARGLMSGDKVKIHNDRGAFVTNVQLNEAVRPGCVRMPSGSWKKNLDSGCFQYVSNNEIYERHSKLILGYMIAFNDTLVEVEKA